LTVTIRLPACCNFTALAKIMLPAILQTLLEIDRQLFYFINHQLHADVLDGLMLGLRYEFTWIPLYAYIMVKVFQYNRPALLHFVLLSVLTFGITDYCSASILKPMVGRLRPCYDSVVSASMYQLLPCGGRFSFPSSHASNHFGLAMCWYACIKTITGKRWHWVWVWAAAICFAQVYVGKHFPLDIAAGMLLGISTGFITGYLFKRWWLRTKNLSWLYKKSLVKTGGA
jgi:undecaprenyl-diphosphatase